MYRHLSLRVPSLVLLALLVSCAKAGAPDPLPPASGAPLASPTSPPADGAKAGSPEARSESPFPLRRGARYVFEGEFRGETSAVELELRATEVDGETAFHFADLGSETDLIAPVLGLGAFVARKDGLYTADVLKAGDIPRLSRASFERMMAEPAVVGAKLQISVPAQSLVPGKDESYHVDALETVTVPAGTYAGCVRLTIESVIEGERESGQVWLAPGVGPVKLVRATGRVDQLKKFTPGH